MKKIVIFRSGTHRTSQGATLEFSEDALQACAKNYDAKLSEAPLVIGHPATNTPAYGWVESVQFEEGVLSITPRQVDPAFSEIVNEGRYKKVSAAFYSPDSPRNPTPGSYYLRHVGFLGAQPPAVKGLPDAAFADGEDGVVVVEFGEEEQRRGVERVIDIAQIFTTLRDWIVSKYGVEEADKAIPIWTVDWMKTDAARTLGKLDAATPSLTPAFTEAEAALARREADLVKREQTIKQQELVQFVEAQVASGRVTPGDKDVVLKVLAGLPGPGPEFSEGESPFEIFKSWIANRPALVTFQEKSSPTPPPTGRRYTPPSGYMVDPDDADTHERILAFAEDNNTDYATAMNAVMKGEKQ